MTAQHEMSYASYGPPDLGFAPVLRAGPHEASSEAHASLLLALASQPTFSTLPLGSSAVVLPQVQVDPVIIAHLNQLHQIDQSIQHLKRAQALHDTLRYCSLLTPEQQAPQQSTAGMRSPDDGCASPTPSQPPSAQWSTWPSNGGLPALLEAVLVAGAEEHFSNQTEPPQLGAKRRNAGGADAKGTRRQKANRGMPRMEEGLDSILSATNVYGGQVGLIGRSLSSISDASTASTAMPEVDAFGRSDSFGCRTSINGTPSSDLAGEARSSTALPSEMDGGMGVGQVGRKPKAAAARSGGGGGIRKQWTADEEERFLKALARFAPNDAEAEGGVKGAVRLGPGVAELISMIVGTRSVVQVRSHAQKHFIRKEREAARRRAAANPE